MRILIAPMAAMAETSGPFSRAVALCNKLTERNHEVAFCAAEDVNYKNIENIKNYYAPIPSPLGLPMFIGKRMLKIGQDLVFSKRKKLTVMSRYYNLLVQSHISIFRKMCYI